MTLIELIAFLFAAAAMLLLLNLTPFKLASDVGSLFKRRRPSLRKRIRAVQKPKEIKGIRRVFLESKQVLKMTNQMNRLYSYCMASFVLSLIGIIVATGLDNIFLVPVFTIGFALLPFLYVLYSASKFRKQLNEELESALSTITTSYQRSENFLEAVKENLEFLNPPIKEIFKRFAVRVESIDPDIVAALEAMKPEIDNNVYREWLDTVILCQRNRGLISTLPPIVAKLSEIRTVTADLDYLMYAPIKGYLTLLSMLTGVIFLICLFGGDWSVFLMQTYLGKFCLAVTALVIFLTLVRVIRLSKPVEFKR